ncbi:SDR family NAD(P)-dependent oxidoreductase [Serinicoccus marinus]|uniref:SDR family NAD(P)-dependent oxidoreductase n=1 Tax=Serinicoccus marinus TaxID=247333 RepID=UPI0024924673|nr:SDR family oxidoreductase [Serinicoccus marinus]
MGTALVTGASSGLGREYAVQLATRGHDLVLVARDRARLEELATELATRHRVAVEVLPADLSDRDDLARVAERVGSTGAQPVDLLVNNAGFGSRRGFVRGDLAEEEAALDLMVRAVMVLSHAAGGAMRSRGRGAILNVSSVASYAVMGHYSAIKAYVTVFSEALATELALHGVTVTAVCPGFVHTEFHARAEMNMSRLPDALWLEAADVVRESLDDVAAGRVVSVPSLTYKALVGVLRLAPRRLTRTVAGSLASRRRAPRRAG